MDGSSSQFDPYTPPNNYQNFQRILLTLRTNQTLNGATILWSSTLLTTIPSSVFLSSLSLLASSISYSNQNLKYLKPKIVT